MRYVALSVTLVAACAHRAEQPPVPEDAHASAEARPDAGRDRQELSPAPDAPPRGLDAERAPDRDAGTVQPPDVRGADRALGARRPNVIVFFADDLGWADLSSFGARTIATPHLDRLAAEGARLTDFYVPQAVCSPSRAALLTGRYPRRYGLNGVFYPASKGGLPAAEITVAEVLRGRGYRTAMVGKWHLGDAAQFLPTAHGFDSYYGIPYSNDMTPTVLMRDTAIIEDPVDQSSLTKRYTEEAVKVIQASEERPFFLYVAHTFPHVPLFASADFAGKSAAGLYGDVVQELDWSVGQVMAAVRSAGLAADTVAFFASDNGPWLQKGKDAGSAGPLRDGKFSVFEGGVRSPGIVWAPGRIPAGRTVAAALSTLDLLPTIAALAAAPLPERPLDGRDMLPALLGTGTAPRELLFFDSRGLGAMRSGRWKVHLARENRPAQIFDLMTDVGEKNDLAAAQAAMTTTLQARARALGDALTP